MRKLTDLVSDVIRDCEAAAPEPTRPSVLPFSAAKPAANTIRRRWRQWSAVAAAACLLLGLGYTVLSGGSGPSMSFPRGNLATVTTSDFPSSPVASHLPLGPGGSEPGSELRFAVQDAHTAAQSAAPLDHVAVIFADGCAVAAESYQRHGDLDLAAFSYQLAYNVREWKLGPDAEPTVQTRRDLGTVYQTALNMNEAVAPTQVVGQPAPKVAGADKAPKREVVQRSAATLCDRLAHQPVEEVRKSVVPILVAKLNEPDCTPEDREQLSRALAELGPAATDAVPALDAFLQNKNLAKREREVPSSKRRIASKRRETSPDRAPRHFFAPKLYILQSPRGLLSPPLTSSRCASSHKSMERNHPRDAE